MSIPNFVSYISRGRWNWNNELFYNKQRDYNLEDFDCILLSESKSMKRTVTKYWFMNIEKSLLDEDLFNENCQHLNLDSTILIDNFEGGTS